MSSSFWTPRGVVRLLSLFAWVSFVCGRNNDGAIAPSHDDCPLATTARRQLDGFIGACFSSDSGCSYTVLAESIYSDESFSSEEAISGWQEISGLTPESLEGCVRARLVAIENIRLSESRCRALVQQLLVGNQAHPLVLAGQLSTIAAEPDRALWLGTKWQSFLDGSHPGVLTGLKFLAGLTDFSWEWMLIDEHFAGEICTSLDPVRKHLGGLFTVATQHLGVSQNIPELENRVRLCITGQDEGLDWLAAVLPPDNVFGNSVPELRVWFQRNFPNGYPVGIVIPVERRPVEVAGPG